MASSTSEKKHIFVYSKPFPPVVDGRINIVQFLQASTDLVAVVERLGHIFAAVKHDMEGNINKIVKNYKYDDNSCLLELMSAETSSSNQSTIVTEGILWLNRALLFFELAFAEMLQHLKYNDTNISTQKIFIVAYEGSVKKYHNWITQKLFALICKMSPTLPQTLAAFEADENISEFIADLECYNTNLHLVRTKIDDFFTDHDLIN